MAQNMHEKPKPLLKVYIKTQKQQMFLMLISQIILQLGLTHKLLKTKKTNIEIGPEHKILLIQTKLSMKKKT